MFIHRLTRYLLGLTLVGTVVGGAGCSTLGAASQGVTDTTTGIKSAESTTQQGVDDTKSHEKLFKKGDKKDGDGAGGGGGGGSDDDPDGTRLGAKGAFCNASNNDNLNPKKGDSIDWKVFTLGGPKAYATFLVNWDETTAELNLDLFNEDGVNIAASPKRNGGQNGKKVLVQIDQPGTYYAKISSIAGGATVYTFKIKWSGSCSAPAGAAAGAQASAAPAAPPPPQQQAAPPAPAAPMAQVPNPGAPAQVPNPGAPAGAPPAAGAPAGAPAAAPPTQVGQAGTGTVPPATDPSHPRGKILGSYRDDDGSLVLYVDRGSAAGLKAGMTGQVLLGAEGDSPLDGGNFRITKIVDTTKSIAKIAKGGRSTLGAKNTRCVLHLIAWP